MPSADRRTIYEKSCCDRRAYSLPATDVPEVPMGELVPAGLRRAAPARLPEVGELDLLRHFTYLSTLNFGVESGSYPLGSCTMKYNPRINEVVSRLEGFAGLHPYQPESLVQGALELMYELERWLAEIAGLHATTLQPAAGAHGELTGLLIIRASHHAQGRDPRRIIIPDTAHGTNPASVIMAGYEPVAVTSDARGGVDLEALRQLLDDDLAGLMLTNPNTLGVFDENITEIARLVHDAGGLLYYDGANINAVLGISRPGDMGFDVVHFNTHKTFSTPHGGGGPGAVGRAERLVGVEVHHVEAHVAGPADAEHGVDVGAVVVEQAAGVMHEPGDLRDVLVEDAEGVGIGEHETGEIVVKQLPERLKVDAAAGVAADGDGLVPRHDDAGRVRAVGGVGDDDAPGVAPLRVMRGADDEQAGELAVGAGRRLESGGVEAGDLGQPPLELVHELERALDERLRLVRMQAGEALQTADHLVDPGVVLHRAGAERIAAALDAEVERRQVREVTQEVQFADLGETRRGRAAQAGRHQLAHRDLGHVGGGQAVGAPVAARLLVDSAPVRARHETPPGSQGEPLRRPRRRPSRRACASR